MNPDCDTIIDIGGQDSKVITIDDLGCVTDFLMNDKCAAGTGRFLGLIDVGIIFVSIIFISSNKTAFVIDEPESNPKLITVH